MTTNISRWDPLRDIDAWMSRMNAANRSHWPFFPAALSSSPDMDWTPTADISETAGEYLIRASLPAVRKEDIHVSVSEGVLTVQGERRQEKSEEGEKFHRVESFFGRFMRSFSIPRDANADGVRCETKDGVLTVHLPKLAGKVAEARKIKVD